MNINMKKLTLLLTSCVLAAILLVGCGAQKPAEQNKRDEPIRLGILTNLNISEQQYAEIMKEAALRGGLPANTLYNITYYDNLNAMQMGLESGSIDAMSLYKSVAGYLMARNSKFELTNFNKAKLSDAFCCAIREEDKELLEKVNGAISSMQQDGTLDRLVKEYIAEAKDKKDIPAVPIAKIDGADTVKVAVTGDLPPIDLTLADGKPAGFNTAVLSEIGKRIGKNIEIEQIASSARATALLSKNVDMVFWAAVPDDDFPDRPGNFDVPKGVVTTTPYYKAEIVHVAVGK